VALGAGLGGWPGIAVDPGEAVGSGDRTTAGVADGNGDDGDRLADSSGVPGGPVAGGEAVGTQPTRTTRRALIANRTGALTAWPSVGPPMLACVLTWSAGMFRSSSRDAMKLRGGRRTRGTSRGEDGPAGEM
jgi:hypothetical protein